MRLMLGTDQRPDLLVDVFDFSNRDEFDFEVINGRWHGKYTNGHLTIDAPSGSWSTLDIIEILCDNQDRLRGDYNDVFANFDNLNYIAPQPKPLPDYWDDDIPF